jgi:hypothetical protein
VAEHSTELELFYDGQWNAAPVYARDGTTVMRGTNDLGNDTEPASGVSTIDNRSGDYSPRSQVSTLRGKIGQNTKSRYVIDGDAVLTGEMASWRPERDVGGDAWTKVEVGGVLRRIGRGKDAFRSTLRRAYAFEPPTCYWPLDDPKGTTVLDGTSPLVLIHGDLELGGDFGLAGASSSLWPGLNVDGIDNYGAYLRSDFDSAPFTSAGYQVEFSGRYHNATPDTPAGLVTVLTTGSMGVLTFTLNPELWDGQSHHVAFYLQQTGPLEVTITRYREGVFYSTEVLSSIDTIGVPYAVEIARGGALTPEAYPSLSSIALYPGFSDPAVRGPAARAWFGETAGNRFIRVSGEQGIAPTVVGTASDTVPMGVQPLDTFLGILDEIARTDDASIFETRGSVGLTMRTGAARMNQAPVLTVSYIGEVQPPLRPEYGDRGIRNDVTAIGPVGPDQRVEQTTGPRNIQAPEDDPQGVGRYATRIDVNPSTVEALYNAAGWRVAVGCFDGTWYAEITVDLDAASHLTDAVALIDIGDVLELTDTPEDESLESFRGLVVGIRNKTSTHRRLVTFYCIPAEPYQVGKLAQTTGDTDPFVGHLETDGSEVTAGNFTPIISDTMEGVGAWSPFDATFVASTAQKHSGTGSGLMTVVGTPSQATVRSKTFAVTPGTPVHGELWAYSVAGYASVYAVFDWYNSSMTYLGTNGGLPAALAAGTWERRGAYANPPAGAAYAQFGPTLGSNPPNGTAVYFDDATVNGDFIVETKTGPLWTLDTDDFPFDVMADGQRVSVSAIRSYIKDPYTRSESSGWGAEPASGLAWSVAGTASQYSVNGTTGLMANATKPVFNRASLLGAVVGDFDVTVTFTIAAAVTGVGGQADISLRTRYAASNTFCDILIFRQTTGVTWTIHYILAGVGVDAGFPAIAGAASGDSVTVRFVGSGTSLYGWAWKTGSTPPVAPMLTLTGCTVLTPGSIELNTSLNASVSNALPLTTGFDNLEFANPQTFTTKPGGYMAEHPVAAGSAVTVQQPIILTQ